MKIAKRTIEKCVEKGPQLKVHKGRIMAVDGTEADMSEWPEGMKFFVVTEDTMRRLDDWLRIIKYWAA